MDLENLKTFISVAETKSFSRSGEMLGLTQPAISKRIAVLEAQLSARLFDRVGRSAQLTEAGWLLFPRAKQIQAELSIAMQVINNHGNEVAGTLAMGTTAYAISNQLPTALQRFQKSFADVALNIKVASTEDIIALMEIHSLELAICPMFESSLKNIPPSLQGIEIWNNNLKAVVGNNHPLIHKPVITPDELRKHNAILPTNASTAEKAIAGALSTGAAELNTVARADDFSTMKSLASIGLGWACIPESLIDDTVSAIDVQGLNLHHSTMLFCRTERTLSRAAQAFIDQLFATVPIRSQTPQTIPAPIAV